MKNFIFLLSFTIVFFSCANRKKDDFPMLSIENSIDVFPDSSFFSDIRCMQYYKGYMYMLDHKRGDIVILDSELKKMKSLSQRGRARNELQYPSYLDIHNDTIFVMDFGSRLIKFFNKEKFIGGIPFPDKNAIDTRFIVTDTSFIMSTAASKGKGLFSEILRNNTEECNYHGVLEEFDTEFRSRIMNRSHLLCNEKYIISIPEALPFIECYDRVTKKLVYKKDLSNISFMETNLNMIKSLKLPENSTMPILGDSYILDNDIFILCHKVKEFVLETNILLNLRIENGLKIKGIYMLPSQDYLSLCVSPTHIIAYSRSSGAIETFNRLDIQ